MNKNEKGLKKILNIVNNYMTRKNCNKDIKSRIRNYFEYLHKETLEMNIEETNDVLNKLSKNLQK